MLVSAVLLICYFFRAELLHKFYGNPQLPFSKGLVAYYPLAGDLKATNQKPRLIYSYQRFPHFIDSGLYLSGNIDDHLELHASGLGRRNQESQSVAFWFRPEFDPAEVVKETGSSALHNLFWEGNETEKAARPRHSLWASFKENYWHVSFSNSADVGQSVSFPNSEVKNAYFIVSTINYSTNQMTLYVNGEKFTQPIASGEALQAPHRFWFGRGWVPETTFKGTISSISLWNTALNQKQVTLLSEARDAYWQRFALVYRGLGYFCLVTFFFLQLVYLRRTIKNIITGSTWARDQVRNWAKILRSLIIQLFEKPELGERQWVEDWAAHFGIESKGVSTFQLKCLLVQKRMPTLPLTQYRFRPDYLIGLFDGLFPKTQPTSKEEAARTLSQKRE